jgi:Porin PorA
VRRIWAWVAVVVGLTFIFLALFFRVYAKTRIEKAPYDIDQTTIAEGHGEYFSPTRLTLVGPTRMENIQVEKGIPEQSTEKVAVISITQRTVDLQATGNPDVSFQRDIYAFDRRSGVAVHCCGESPRAEGQTLKFPFGVDKSVAYPLYDSTAHKAFPAKFVRTEDVDGLESFVFVSEVPPTSLGSLDLPGSLAGHPELGSVTTQHMYSATTTVWVEPTTGAILRGGQHATQWAEDATGARVQVLANTDFLYSPASVQRTVDKVSSKISQLKIVTTWVPIFGPIAGLILVAVGLLLMREPRTGATARRTRRKRAAPATPEPATT